MRMTLVLKVEDRETGDARSYAYDATTLLVGRDPSADLRIVRRDVSQLHGRFHRRGAELFYTDLNSSNGTIMDRQLLPAAEEVKVPTGARLWLGQVRITASVADEGAAIGVGDPLSPDPFICLPTERHNRSQDDDAAHARKAVPAVGETGQPRSDAPAGAAPTPTTAEEPIWGRPNPAAKGSGTLVGARAGSKDQLSMSAPTLVRAEGEARRSPPRSTDPRAATATADHAAQPSRADYVRFPELDPGTRLGDYEITKLIGRGGMGRVYEARHASLGKAVALKVLQGELAKNPLLQKRFFREAVAAAQLRNPHIVDVTHVGDENGIPYIVMELLRGEDLSALIARERHLSVERTVAILLPVCWAVYTTHRAGMIHRDLKPPNIFLQRASMGVIIPKVLDFGIVKLLNEDIAESNLTAEGDFIGTPEYAAPETLLQGAIDAQTDQYALGVILYECVTGERPFSGHSPYDVLRQVSEGKFIHPCRRVPELPAAFGDIVVRAMSRQSTDRYASVYELARALLSFADVKRRAQWDDVFGGERPPTALSVPVGISFERAAPPAQSPWSTRRPLGDAANPAPGQPEKPGPAEAARAALPSPSEPRVPSPQDERTGRVYPGGRRRALLTWSLLALVGAIGTTVAYLVAR